MSHHLIEKRALLLAYREVMVADPNNSYLSPVIVKINEELDAIAATLQENLLDGRTTIQEIFQSLEYGVAIPLPTTARSNHDTNTTKDY